MASVAVRVEEAFLEDVKRLAALRGETPGALLAEAWTEFVERHRGEIASDFEAVAEMFRNGDRKGLAAFSARTRESRADAAAARANR
jgi:hypothetical protein